MTIVRGNGNTTTYVKQLVIGGKALVLGVIARYNILDERILLTGAFHLRIFSLFIHDVYGSGVSLLLQEVGLSGLHRCIRSPSRVAQIQDTSQTLTQRRSNWLQVTICTRYRC